MASQDQPGNVDASRARHDDGEQHIAGDEAERAALSTVTTPATLVDLKPSLGTTTATDPATFEHPVVTVDNQFTEQLVDANADCVYDQLRVAGMVTVETAGSYQVNARLVADDGTQVAQIATTRSLTGTMPSWLDFPGSTIRASGKNGPYRAVDLHIYPVARPNAAATYLDVYTTWPYRMDQLTVSSCGRGQYVPLTPMRIEGTAAAGRALGAGATYTMSVLGRGGIPASGVSAVAFQLTGGSVDCDVVDLDPALGE
jgi:hypothetical protein